MQVTGIVYSYWHRDPWKCYHRHKMVLMMLVGSEPAPADRLIHDKRWIGDLRPAQPRSGRWPGPVDGVAAGATFWHP